MNSFQKIKQHKQYIHTRLKTSLRTLCFELYKAIQFKDLKQL